MKQFRAMNKLKKLALKVIAANLSEEDIKGLKARFTNLDTDNSGTITYEELKIGLARLGLRLYQRRKSSNLWMQIVWTGVKFFKG
ncbi:hypothetical protein MLD38_036508 [Melastoma candidum]|uniref:Uncharacterized protein n=1 Tax=Melastoma candidum TaxID=119954 RepID=A0ACB9LJ94_9MYRT|nr:hypothetical protein MLD38_036508 [Melastoma candidum]